MFDAGSMEFSRRLQTKNLVFGLIAAMAAYVLWHNERFLIEPLSPIWKHYRDLGVFLLVHGVAGGSALAGMVTMKASNPGPAMPLSMAASGLAAVTICGPSPPFSHVEQAYFLRT